MQIVIDIPDNYILSNIKNGSIASQMILNAIMNGKPLPKGHGRLIDADRIVRTAKKDGFGNHRDIDFVLSYIPKCKTIIEADKE